MDESLINFVPPVPPATERPGQEFGADDLFSRFFRWIFGEN